MFPKVNRRIQQYLFRNFCTKAAKSKPLRIDNTCVKSCGSIGQPTFETHPHLLKSQEITPRITKLEYQTRRRKLVEAIASYSIDCKKQHKNHLIVVPAASKKYMSDKIPYVFRQNTDFLYLTGCQEPDCCIVLTIGDIPDKNCSILFTRDKDEHSELWDGPRTYPEDAPQFFGVDQSLPISELENYMRMFQKNHKNVAIWYDFMNPIQNVVHKIVENFFNATKNKAFESPISFLHKIRLFKSPAEIELMQESCDIAAHAFKSAISFSKPGTDENQLFATVDYECRMRGAEFLAYPPVIAGGSRATIIHYINNNQLVKNGEMVLMDAGCEYHGYASDITRTWPINGKFSPQQREIYEAVLSVQEDLITYCGTFPTLDNLFNSMCCLLGKKMQEIGLVGVQPSSQYLMKAAYQVCPHHVSHYLGMDVHDTPQIPRNIPIQSGMVITVEPGIYISKKHGNISKQYHGIGVRIEDDVLITENGPVVLSRNTPKQIDQIENISMENQ